MKGDFLLCQALLEFWVHVGEGFSLLLLTGLEICPLVQVDLCVGFPCEL